MAVNKADLQAALQQFSAANPDLAHVITDFWSTIPRDAASQEDALLEDFIGYLRKVDKVCNVLAWFLETELQTSDRNSLFRSDTVGMALISTLWFKFEGVNYLEQTLTLLLTSIGRVPHSLEIDSFRAEKGDNVKKNADQIMEALDDFLLKLYSSESIFPRYFKILLQAIDRSLAVRFDDVGLSLVGGLLFLRLLNPAIIFPSKYGLTSADALTPGGYRGLVICSKVLQAMANETEFGANKDPSMMITNRFMRRHRNKWRKFFYKLMTGEDEFNVDSTIALDVTAEDLITRTNHSIHDIVCPVTLSKQKDIINKLLNLEKQAQDWETEHHKLYTASFKRFECSRKIISKLTTTVPFTVPEVYKMIAAVCDSGEVQPGVVQASIVKDFNENLRWIHSELRLPFPYADRDFSCLAYRELLPDANFGISALTSGDCPYMPEPKKGVVRAQLFSGFILRAASDNAQHTTITQVMHLDLQGNTGFLPTSMLKRQVLTVQSGNLKHLLKTFPGYLNEKGRLRTNSSSSLDAASPQRRDSSEKDKRMSMSRAVTRQISS